MIKNKQIGKYKSNDCLRNIPMIGVRTVENRAMNNKTFRKKSKLLLVLFFWYAKNNEVAIEPSGI